MTVLRGPVLTYEEVAGWIEDMAPGDVAGWTGSASCCPLARCGEAQGMDRLFVGDRLSWCIDGVWSEREMTPFEHFIENHVDALGLHRKVYAADMRDILRRWVV